jgi:outer membrane immunogenic protein
LGISASKSFFQPGTDAACQITYPGDRYPTAYGGWACNVAGKYSVSSDLYGDLTARLGYEMDRILLYAKGGAALLNADFKANYVGNNCTVLGPYCERVGGGGTYNTVAGHAVFNFDHSDTLLGWTVGAGAEYALSPSWSVKAEYQHFDFGKISYSYYGCYGFPLASGSYSDPSYGKCPAGAPSYDNHYTSTLRGRTEVSITADAVKLGINYHLNDQAGLR